MKTLPTIINILSAVLLILPVFLCGCGKKYDPQKTVARINDYYMTVEDYKSELDTTYMGKKGVLSGEQMLDDIIANEILVQEAQRLGLDKEKTFMKTIERYWKHALRKELLDRKDREISGKQGLSDSEKAKMMQSWYNKLYKKARVDKFLRVLEDAK
ncbi:MAG: hypothetical protein PHV77_02490 [Candidatus Omnitrophica bacterium]|nr:hypothetical protein [Candidatus Omnitrophota bacterium]